jgi:hypothetical protein
MARRKNKFNADADQRQDELDLEQSEGQNGTLDPNAALPAEIDPPAAAAAEERSEADGQPDRGNERRPPAVLLPTFSLGGAWETNTGLSIGATTMKTLRFKRLATLAAAVALAAALGAIAGSLATRGLDSVAARRANGAETAYKVVLDRLEQEVTALRTSVDKSTQDLDARTDRIAERLDRNERAQSEPAAKLAKIGEAIERLERRSVQTTQVAATQTAPAGANAAAGDVTGALGEPRATAPEHRPAIVSGWTVRHARNGAALIEGREGLVEIETGDILPGLGRVEAIRKQEGRWVVVTSRGLIVTR